MLETGLNLLWAAIAVSALGVWIVSSRRALTWNRALSLILAIIFLFPCVSSSDDLLSLSTLHYNDAREHLGSPTAHHPADSRPAYYLERFFDSLQNFQTISVCLLALTLCFFALAARPARQALKRHPLTFTGRAPPFPLPDSL